VITRAQSWDNRSARNQRRRYCRCTMRQCTGIIVLQLPSAASRISPELKSHTRAEIAPELPFACCVIIRAEISARGCGCWDNRSARNHSGAAIADAKCVLSTWSALLRQCRLDVWEWEVGIAAAPNCRAMHVLHFFLGGWPKWGLCSPNFVLAFFCKFCEHWPHFKWQAWRLD
jgi:hypothetical protein